MKEALVENCEIITHLLQLRIKKNLSIKQVSNLMGITERKLNKIEAGTDEGLTVAMFVKYIKALGFLSIKFCEY